MAVIPISERANPSRVQGDRLSYEPTNMLSGPGRALEGLGNALSNLGERYNAEQQKMERYNTNVALERWSTEQTIQYEKTLNESAPDGSDFIQKQEKNLLDSYQKVRSTIKDPENQRHADMIFERVRGGQMVKGFGDVSDRRTNYVEQTTGEAVRSAIDTQQINTNEDYNRFFEGVVLPRIDEYVDDPVRREALKKAFGREMASEFMSRVPEYAAPRKVSVIKPAQDGDLGSIIKWGAAELGVDPVDLATAISYETLGKFSTSIQGGKGGRYLGLIQFGPEEQRQFGVHRGQSTLEQMKSVVAFMKARGLKPGMGLLDIYSTINAGSPGHYNRSDRPGYTVARHVQEMAQSRHRKNAEAIVGGKGGVVTVSTQQFTKAKPTGGMWDYVDQKEWNAFVKKGEAESRSRMDKEQGILDSNLDDFYSGIRTSGRSNITEPTAQDFVSAYGEDDGPEQFRNHLKNKQLAYDQFNMRDMPLEQIDALVKQRESELTLGADASEDEKRLAALSASAKTEAAIFEQKESKRRQELRDRIERYDDDVIASISQTGTYDGWTPTLENYVDVYGEMNGQLLFSKVKSFTKAADDARQFGTSSTADIQKALAQYREEIKGEGAKDAADRYAALTQAASEVIKARADDPATYVYQNFPAVAEQFDAYSQSKDPADLKLAYDMMQKAQDQLGIPEEEQRLLPKATADATVDSLNDVETPVDERIAGLSGVVFSSGNDEYTSKIVNDLIDAGMPRGAATALAAIERGDMQGARRLFDAVLVPKDKERIVKLDQEQSVALNQMLAKEMLTGRGVIVYGLNGANDPRKMEQFMADRALIERSVDLRMANGQTMDQAVKDTLKDVYGDTQRITGDNIDIIAPVGVDESMVRTGLHSLNSQVREQLEAVADAEVEKIISDKSSGPTPDEEFVREQAYGLRARTKNAIEEIMASGVWTSVGEKFGFLNPYDGKLVAGPDGKPILFSVGDVEQGAANAPRLGPRGLSNEPKPSDNAPIKPLGEQNKPPSRWPRRKGGQFYRGPGLPPPPGKDKPKKRGNIRGGS